MNEFFKDITKPLLVALLLSLAGLFARFEVMAWKVNDIYEWKKYQTGLLNTQLDSMIEKINAINLEVHGIKAKIEASQKK